MLYQGKFFSLDMAFVLNYGWYSSMALSFNLDIWM